MEKIDLTILLLEAVMVHPHPSEHILYHKIDNPAIFAVLEKEGNDYRVQHRGCICTIYGKLNLESITNALAFCGYHPAIVYNRIYKIDNLLV